MFDIHKVKPVHGWREFVGEVGIIVLGVLIALSAEQIVERLRWRTEVRETTEALNASLAGSREQAIERIYVNSCVKKQIAQVTNYVVRAANKTPVRVHGAPMRPWEESSWTTATTSGVITHMPLDTRAKYAALYDTVAALKKANAEEFALWGDLTSLNIDKSVDAVARDRLKSDLARAGTLNFLVVTASRQFNEEAKALGIHLRGEDVVNLREVRETKCLY